MKVVRILLFPIVPIYFIVTWLRNILYDYGIKPSKSYDFPVICVGNLSTGGTGKTPMIEYLVNVLQPKYKIATLSRGYKRKTSGFILADENSTAHSIGDEPFQFYKKFPKISVAVDEDRQRGIERLKELNPNINAILLDDAFQHRKVKAGLNILLTAYDSPYFEDFVLPSGNLREPRSGADRADIIVLTKCPEELSDQDRQSIKFKIKPRPHQGVFFSHISYSKIIFSGSSQMELKLAENFTLVTGIANPKPLVDHLKSLGLNFKHVQYPDHYDFKASDIEMLKTKPFIITTEKDYVRLIEFKALENKLYYLPIELTICEEDRFEKLVLSRIER